MDVKFVFPVTKASFWLGKLYFSTTFDSFHDHFLNLGMPAPIKKKPWSGWLIAQGGWGRPQSPQFSGWLIAHGGGRRPSIFLLFHVLIEQGPCPRNVTPPPCSINKGRVIFSK